MCLGGLLMPTAASRPPAAHRPAHSSTAWWKPDENADRFVMPVWLRPTAAGSTATATRPAVRATVLFTADAMPAFSSPAEESTVAVNGAMVRDRPSAMTRVAGSTSARYVLPWPTRVYRTKPAPATL